MQENTMIIKLKMNPLIYFIGIILCVINYVQYGITPIMLKYLQNNNVPSLSLTAASNILVLIIYMPRIIYLLYKYRFDHIYKVFNNKLNTGLLITITVVILIRSIMVIYGIKLTKSIYFQIINLTGPFFTICCSFVLDKFFDRINITQFKNILKTRITLQVFLSIVGVLIGGFVTILTLQDKDKSRFKYLINFEVLIDNSFGFNDVIGLILLITSMTFIATYNICIKLLNNKEQTDIESQNNADNGKVSNEFIFIHHLIIYSLFYSISSICIEDWTFIFDVNKMGYMSYILLIVYGLTAYFLGNVVYFLAISFSSTTTFSLFTSISLLTGVLLSGFFFPDEKITNLWTILGTSLTIVCITLFVVFKYKSEL